MVIILLTFSLPSSLLNSLLKVCGKGLLGALLLFSSPLLFSGVAVAQEPDTEDVAPEQSFRAAIANDNDLLLVNMLVKSSLTALNQANLTNNYSVLLDLASEEFQANNSETTLAEAFRPVRESGLNFAGIVEYQPVFSAPPTLDDQDMLRVIGYFDTVPRIEYGLVFQPVEGRFLVDALSINIVPVTDEVEAEESTVE